MKTALVVVAGCAAVVGLLGYMLTTREFMGVVVALFVLWLWASTISS